VRMVVAVAVLMASANMAGAMAALEAVVAAAVAVVVAAREAVALQVVEMDGVMVTWVAAVSMAGLDMAAMATAMAAGQAVLMMMLKGQKRELVLVVNAVVVAAVEVPRKLGDLGAASDSTAGVRAQGCALHWVGLVIVWMAMAYA
jgi:hypothetical protein